MRADQRSRKLVRKLANLLHREGLNKKRRARLKAYIAQGDYPALLDGFKRWTKRNLRRVKRNLLPTRNFGIPPNPLSGWIEWKPDLPDDMPLPDENALRQELLAKISAYDDLVSVIIPCYNYGKYVTEAVQSVLNQLYKNIEIIVVDDGSTDDYTRKVLNKLDHPRVRVVHQRNQGLAQTRNNGAMVAKGKYLLFLDADDMLDEKAIPLMLHQLKRNPDVHFVYSHYRCFGDEAHVWCCNRFNPYDQLWNNHISVCILIDKDVFDTSRKYAPEMKYGYEDWEYALWLSTHGYKGRLVPVPVFRHRRHGITMTHTADQKKRDTFKIMVNLDPDIYNPSTVRELKLRWRLLVSVIVPLSGHDAQVAETINSLLAQSTDDFEVVFAPCGAGEFDAKDVIGDADKRLADNGIRTKVLDQRSSNHCQAINQAALASNGEFMIILDGSAVIASGYLERSAVRMLFNRSHAFLYPCPKSDQPIHEQKTKPLEVNKLLKNNIIAQHSLIRRDVFLSEGGLDVKLDARLAMHDLWLRLVERGYTGLRLPGEDAGDNGQTALADNELDLMKARHPLLYKVKTRQRPPILAPLSEPATDDGLIRGYELLYAYPKVTKPVNYLGYRRVNTPNLFRHGSGDSAKANILYLIPWMVMGGAEVIDLEIIDALKAEGYRIILAIERFEDHVWEERFGEKCDEIHKLPDFLDNDSQFDRYLDYLLISRNIDIAFNRNTAMGYRAFERWHGQFQDLRLADLQHIHREGHDWCDASAPYHKYMHRRYVITEDLRDYMVNRFGFKPDELTIIYCGIDEQAWNPHRIEKGILRKLIGARENIPIVAFVGRFDHQKDPLKWIDVAKEIHKKNPDIIFPMIGDGSLLKKCKDRANELGLKEVIHFLGRRSDMPQMMVDCDCILMTSDYEGLPLVVFEAMSLGVAVVSSNVGGTRECLTPELGRLLPVKAPADEYAMAVIDLLEQFKENPDLRSKCRQRVLDNFRISQMQRRYVEEFESMLSEINREKRIEEVFIYLLTNPLFE